MMQLERRALYNSLRMNHFYEPSMAVEKWQVEDYRLLALEELFDRLQAQNIFLDKVSLFSLAEKTESPEELTDDLVADANLTNQDQDKVYLVVFELWRRLLPEKLCLSIFCDELDYQIFLYDRGEVVNQEAIADIVANLEVILDENADNGADPVEIFQSVSAGCANDIESFLYDFISQQIEMQNLSYASELLDGFIEYVQDERWFEFLRARILSYTDSASAAKLIHQLALDAQEQPDLEFNLELLSSLFQIEDQTSFQKLVTETIPLLETEEDFQDLLSICADFYQRLDFEDHERELHLLLRKRSDKKLSHRFNPNDADIAEMLKVLNY